MPGTVGAERPYCGLAKAKEGKVNGCKKKIDSFVGSYKTPMISIPTILIIYQVSLVLILVEFSKAIFSTVSLHLALTALSDGNYLSQMG